MPTLLTVGERALQLLEVIGRGATSTVFLARDATTGERFALKAGRSDQEAGIFANEVRRHAWVSCPEIIPLFACASAHCDVTTTAGESVRRGAPLLLFPWIDGQSLKALGGSDGPAETAHLDRTLHVAWSLGRALDELHELGLAHGDIKPGNVMLAGKGEGEVETSVQLLDLGLTGAGSQRTLQGGTPRYLDPDILSGENRGDARARDLFALGLLLAEISDPELAQSSELQRALAKGSLHPKVDALVSPLLRATPAARPSARWLWQRAGQALGRTESTLSARAWRLRRARSAYLKARTTELSLAWSAKPQLLVSPIEASWLTDFFRLGGQAGAFLGTSQAKSQELRALEHDGLAAFLVHLIGPSASEWPLGLLGPVPALLARVLELLEQHEPAALTFAMLQSHSVSLAIPSSGDPLLSLMLELADPVQAHGAVNRAEALIAGGHAPVPFIECVARRLRLMGEFGRALVLLEGSKTPGHQVFAAETYRRAREPAKAQASVNLLRQAWASLTPGEQAQLCATEARLLLATSEVERALVALQAAPEISVVWETRAQIELQLGSTGQALASAERARATASNDEERARADAVLGLVAHQKGEAETELACYQRAAEHAARAGAVIEEAHYLTGVAAASVQVGSYDLALNSAARARLIFDWAGRGSSAARAAQAESAVYAALGAIEEAEQCADEAQRRAKLAGDVQCRAYVHLTLADLVPPSLKGREHAERARQLLGDKISDSDQVRVAARALKHGASVNISVQDACVRRADALDAALEWWSARAEHCRKSLDLQAGNAVVLELLALSTARAPAAVRGPAFASGAQLASELGDGDSARRLFAAAGDAARLVLASAPSALKARVAALSWVERCQAVRERSLLPEQLSDVEGLIRALGGRENRRLLFERILDMLVLWTGVERALLLLPAPNGKLVVRCARNLARTDLHGPQLELSRSLAARALEEGAPVVAVDAQFDLPEAHASVHALKLRSVLAVPLLAHGQKLGVVYLDDRVKRGAFGPQELGWVRVIASLAAIALADTRADLLLRRSLRRVSRAENRARLQLGQREVELDVAQRELARARNGRTTRYAYDAIVGESPAVIRMLSLIDRVAGADIPVLVVGQSGSGKELVARALHANSSRANGPFVSENCASIPETLLESALFGHVRGAFTGASHTRSGLFDAADGGTLFLDEIGEMSLGMQTKLLRVLEDGLVKPVGSERARKVNVRVLGATHRDLEAWVASGRFRQDLYYRLNVLTLKVPALHERVGDVALLIKHFIAQYSPDRPRRLARGAEVALLAYSWPGNVRQLQNELRRALLMADDVIEVEHLSPQLVGASPGELAGTDSVNLKVRVDALERHLVGLALERTSGNQTRAAEMLGVSRFGLQKMIKRLEIDAKG